MSNPALTVAPIQVDTTGEESGVLGTGVCSQGPYKNSSGDIYAILQTQNGPPYHVNCFKQTAGVGGFARVGSQLATQLSALLYCQFKSTGGTGAKGLITVARALVTGPSPVTVRWATFDCGTDTFTDTALPDLTDVNGTGGQPSIPFVTRANGDTLIVYSTAAGNVGFRVCTGGVWSGFTIAFNTAAHTYIAQGLYIDPTTGIACAIISDRTGGVTTWRSFTISAANAVGGLVNIQGAQASDVLNYGLLASNGFLYIPLSRGAGNSAAALFSAQFPPALWTVTTFDTQATNNIVTAGIIEDPANTLLYFWEFEDNSGSPNVVKVSANVSGAGWGAATTYYDLVALPPNATLPSAQNVSQFNPAAGSTLSLMTMLTFPDSAFAAFFAGAASSSGSGTSVGSTITAANIFPFPMGPDCCCPAEDVACLHPSGDGEYYVASKGVQKKHG